MKNDHRGVFYAVSRLGAIFAVTHLIFTIVASLQHSEGSWDYVPFVLPDFPVMIILALANRFFALELGWPYVAVLGTVWWYFVGVWVERIYRNRKNKADTG